MTRPTLCIAALLALAAPALAAEPLRAEIAAGQPSHLDPAAVTPSPSVKDVADILAWRDDISPELRRELAARCSTLASAEIVPPQAAAFCAAFSGTLSRPLE